MREWILTFLEEKQNLSSNSKQSYKYDLEQFLDLIGGRISETSLKINYQILKLVPKSVKFLLAINFFTFYIRKERLAPFIV